MAISDLDAWQDGEFAFNVEPEADGSYAIESEDPFYFVSGSTVADPEITPADVTVLFFKEAGTAGFSDEDKLVLYTETVEGRFGGTPKAVANDYYAVVFQGDLLGSDGSLYNPTAQDTLATIIASNEGAVYAPFKLSVSKKTDSVEGAFFYQPKASDEDYADRTFNYTGGQLEVKVGMGKSDITEGVDVQFTQIPEGAAAPVKTADGYAVTDAGTYKATVKGNGAMVDGDEQYSGTVELELTVNAIDLATAQITIEPRKVGEGWSALNAGVLANNATALKVNGESLAAGAELKVTLLTQNGDAVASDANSNEDIKGKASELVFRVEDTDTTSANVVGSAASVTTYLVTDTVQYNYLTDPISDGSLSFDAAKGTYFVEDAVSALTVDGKKDVTDKTDISVTKDGVEVSDFTQPGEYVLNLSTPAPADYAYAGSGSYKFTVAGADYSDAVIYVSWDGKNVADGAEFGYTGEAIAPTVTVKLGKETLVQGEDYTVEMTDASGVAVESAVEPGDYILAFEFAGTEPTGFSGKFGFTINKAKIESAEPAADFFATDGETAASPAFVGSNSADFDRGLKFDLAAEDIDVVYYKGEFTKDTDGDSKADAWEASTTRVAAEDLTEEGVYFANIQVKSTAAKIQNGDKAPLSVQFTVSKTVVFHDVDANAWYAGSVYDAALLGYMDGVAQGIFAPERAMTRAEFAQVVYNMATNGTGGTTANGTTYPTKYTDVPADAWYAKAIEWASRYGIVNGTSETTFDPNGTVTREQIATMLYRYAGNNAQADASALDAFVDGAQVSDWAVPAMAWAVEEGHMNGKGANDLQPQATATRAEIATLAVRVQPEWL